MKHDTNLTVIGAGSGGLVSAYIAAAIKAKVILIERAEMGGDCLNTGCVPSKALLASAKLLHDMRGADRWAITPADPQVNFAGIMQRVHQVIAKVEPHDSVERYTGLGVEVIKGHAEILNPNQVRVNDRIITSRNLIIAAGAEPFVPPIKGLDQIDYRTSDTLWKMTELPKRLVILGGGPIGCEMAQCFSRFGSQVHMVEMAPRIMAREDEDTAEFMTRVFESEGIHLHTGHRAMEVAVRDGKKTLICDRDGSEVAIEFDDILVAVGRAARTTGYGLENINAPLTPRRTIQTNEYLQVGDYKHIYAVGDVTGPYQFTHSAGHQAWYATVNALFRPFKKFKVDYHALPWATYTDPEVAHVGLSEQMAKEQNIAYEVTKYEFSELDRAIADSHTEGHIKVLTAPGRDRILGATLISRHGSDLLAEFALAMKHGLGLNKILGTIHAYPSWPESAKHTAGQWKQAHAPAWALALLKRYHSLRR